MLGSLIVTALFSMNNVGAADKPDLSDLGGVHSAYTERVARLVADELVKSSMAMPLSPSPQGARPDPIFLRCWTTAGNDLYIGLEQRMHIDAPIKNVVSILDDFSVYDSLFPGFSDIHLIQQDGKKSYSYWEQTVPLPLVPNVKYEMIYQSDWLGEKKRLYRYQLRKPTTLVASDGFILLSEEAGGRGTFFVEYDFFDAKWGAAKMFGHKKLWLDAIEGMAQSDVAIKLKAEHPEWKPREARRQSRKALASQLMESCYTSRQPIKPGN